jgi:hypothetical protein
MEEININYNPIYTLGYITCNVPDDVYTPIVHEIQELFNTRFINAVPYNQRLAGAIEHEYNLLTCSDILNKFFKHIIPEYWKLQGNISESKITYELAEQNKMPDVWVNFQQKYEFNPLHDHSGILSFVLYINIPYILAEEAEQPHVKNNPDKVLPSFNFVYPRLPGQAGKIVKIEELFIDKTWEGKMIIFPAWLLHQVTPFYTSNNYRISVSGNLVPKK